MNSSHIIFVPNQSCNLSRKTRLNPPEQ
ncbi:unnamed protein product, partial [Vitis vinifera]|uniref:Uncharacterized protein n=1 Tax=Vitis vinifera TaxID=29760 RepID=D7SW55_VITVI